jgi:CBS-domain-containing membrane protein
MTAKNIMSTDLVTLRPNVCVAEALQIMCERKVHNMPVVDEHGVFIGLFSLRRITHALLPMAAQMEEFDPSLNIAFIDDGSDAYLERLQRLGACPVEELLEKKKKLRFCSPNTPIPRLLQLLSENPTSLPVVVVEGEQKKVVGMVSTWDVLTKITNTLFVADATAECASAKGSESQ